MNEPSTAELRALEAERDLSILKTRAAAAKRALLLAKGKDEPRFSERLAQVQEQINIAEKRAWAARMRVHLEELRKEREERAQKGNCKISGPSR